MTTIKTTLTTSMTVLDTTAFFSRNSIPYFEANFHIQDHDVLYGDGTIMTAVGKSGAILTYKNGDLRDMFFKNRTAGQTATVVCVATVPKVTTR